MKRYSYTAEKAKREIEAYFASLEVPAVSSPAGAAGQQVNSWEGEGAVEGCRIQGKLTVGKGSRVVNCHIGSEADVVIGDNCFVYSCAFSDKTEIEIGNACQLVSSTFLFSTKIGCGSKAVQVTAYTPLTAGPRFLAKAVMIEALTDAAVSVGADAVMFGVCWQGNLVAGNRLVLSTHQCQDSSVLRTHMFVPRGLVVGDDVRLEFNGRLVANSPIRIGNGTIVQSATKDPQAFAEGKIDIRNNVRFVLASISSYSSRLVPSCSGSLFVDDNAEVYVTQSTGPSGLLTVKKSTVVAI